MALRIVDRKTFDASEHYEVISGKIRIGSIWKPHVKHDIDQTYDWHFAFRPGGHLIAPSMARAKEQFRTHWDEWLKQAELSEIHPAPENALLEQAMEEDVDAVLAEFEGDPRRAINALLHDLGQLAADAEALFSKGYIRGVRFTAAYAHRRKTANENP